MTSNRKMLKYCLFFVTTVVVTLTSWRLVASISDFKKNDLYGTWNLRNICIPNIAKSGVIFQNKIVSFGADGTYVQQAYSFKDSQCSKLISVQNVVGQYTAETSNAKQIDLDYALKKWSVVPADSISAAIFNASKYCGIESWLAGEETEITGKLCNEIKIPNSETMAYSKVEIEGNLLKLGIENDVNNGTSLKQRHNKIDADNIFVKKTY